MAIYKFTRSQLKGQRAKDYKDGDMVDIINKDGDLVYTINIFYGQYSSPLKTNVTDKDYNLLGCTAGTPNGWPYYIADFIHAL